MEEITINKPYNKEDLDVFDSFASHGKLLFNEDRSNEKLDVILNITRGIYNLPSFDKQDGWSDLSVINLTKWIFDYNGEEIYKRYRNLYAT